MVDAPVHSDPPEARHPGMPLDRLPALVFDALLQVQHEQFALFGAWLQSVVALQADAQQRWLVAWAGGVPLDG